MVKIIGRVASNYSKDSSNKVTLTETLQVEGDTLAEIAQSKLLPAINDTYSGFPNIVLNNIEIEPNGNIERKVQALATLTYSTLSEQNGGSSNEEEEPPTIGITSVSLSYNEFTRPLTEAYNRFGRMIPLINSAGCRILAETTSFILSLNVNFRDRNEPPIISFPIINNFTEYIAGHKIEPYKGKLMPISMTYTRENGENFYDSSLSVLIHPQTWEIDFLNVGTMCYWDSIKDEYGKMLRRPANIYRYTPWESADVAANMKTKPKYGSIDDVIIAQKKYWDITGDKTDRIPYEEVTEPMPLDKDGTLLETALESFINPENDDEGVGGEGELLDEYLKFKRFDCPVAKWPEGLPTTLDWKGYVPPR